MIKKVVKKDSGEHPRFIKPIQPQVVKESENAIFTAQVAGAPRPQVSWIKDKKPLKLDDRITCETDEKTNIYRLIIHKATEADIGVYSCHAENTAGRANSTANVVVVRKYTGF